MYNAILIDDEETVRRGLTEHFDWAYFGVRVAAEFPDCAQAYEYVKTHEVDIVVTDVVTPVMDGIALATLLQKEYPRIRIVFVSGHADVNLLRSAMKTDAIDYILKSVDLNELAATIRKVVKQLDERNRRDDYVRSMEERMHQMQPVLRERFLRSILEHDSNYDEVGYREAQYLGVDLDMSARYVLILVRLRNRWEVFRNTSETERLRCGVQIEEICSRAAEHYAGSLCFKNRISEYAILLKYDPASYEKDIIELTDEVQRELLSQTGLKLNIGVSSPVAPAGLPEARDEAVEAIEHRYYLEHSNIAMSKFPAEKNEKTIRRMIADKLGEVLPGGDLEEVKQAVGELIERVRGTSEEERDNLMIYLLNYPARLLLDLKNSEKGPYRNQKRLLSDWINCQVPSEQDQMIYAVMDETAKILSARNAPESNVAVYAVRQNIEEQYMDQISVNSLAEGVSLTPAYLCVLFKQSTGKTINEYLTQVRMEKAMEFLRDPGIKLYDICYRVGYLSPSYFSKVFKKHTGMTPGDYREQTIREE